MIAIYENELVNVLPCDENFCPVEESELYIDCDNPNSYHESSLNFDTPRNVLESALDRGVTDDEVEDAVYSWEMNIISQRDRYICHYLVEIGKEAAAYVDSGEMLSREELDNLFP